MRKCERAAVLRQGEAALADEADVAVLRPIFDPKQMEQRFGENLDAYLRQGLQKRELAPGPVVRVLLHLAAGIAVVTSRTQHEFITACQRAWEAEKEARP